MAILVDPAYLPATLTVGPMTDEEFAALCEEHPDLELETNGEGELVVMPQTYTVTGLRNQDIGFQLHGWARKSRTGYAFDSSTGFVLPDGARRSPDASWVSRDHAARVNPEHVLRYWRLCPDFVIELKSESDRPLRLRNKMREWIKNGAQLAWLLDPETRTVEIYRPDAEPEMIANASEVRGEGPVDGFVLDLATVWNPLT